MTHTSIPSTDLPAALGVPALLSMSDLARHMGVTPDRLSPSKLTDSSSVALCLRLAVARLRGEEHVPMRPREWAWSGALIERLDMGEEYSVERLAARMRTWGMDTADDWIVSLHRAGAPVVFAERGWCGVRQWAREVVR